MRHRHAAPHAPASRRALRCLAAGLAFGGSLVVGTAAAPPVGAATSTTTFSYAGPAVPIADGADLSGTAPGAPAAAAVAVAGLPGVVTDIDLRIDGSACSATAGSTTVGIDHTFVNDLDVTLISPDGTEVLLIDNADGSGNNLCQTLLDDDAVAPSIQAAITANAPFTGTWTPNAPLSAFDGEDPNGNWTLRVQDFFAQDTGNIRAFSVLITTQTTNAVAATKTVSGSFAEGGTVTYTVTLTNSGNVASTDNPGNELVDVLPSQLTFVSATATSGTATATPGTGTVTWNGGIPAAGTVDVTITATVDAGTENQVVSNQGTVNFDADVNGTNESTTTTDASPDPGSQATTFTVGGVPPTATIDQGAGQADPTSTSPILFAVVFSEPVTGFDGADVVLGGTAGATTAVVTGAGPNFTVSVSGMTQSGTVTASIPAGAAVDVNGNQSLASTSTDATVTFAVPVAPTTTSTTAPTATTATTATAPTTGTTARVGGSTLARTGSSSGPAELQMAAGLVLIGFGFLLLGRNAPLRFRSAGTR